MQKKQTNNNLVPRTFTLTWGTSQGKGPGNEVEQTNKNKLYQAHGRVSCCSLTAAVCDIVVE